MRVSDLEIPAERDFPPGRHERRARHLVHELSASRRRRRLVFTLVPAVVVLLTAATGFTAYTLLRTEPSHFETIGCFDRADLSANVSIVGADGRGAVAQCRELWLQGGVGDRAPASLAACVLKTGPIGVFPSVDDRTCERLGLADLSARGAAEGQRFVRMREAIYAEIGTPPSGSSSGSSHCIGEARARAIVRRVLDVHGYRDWTVRTVGEPFSRERPCADISFDGGSKEALLMAGGRGAEG
jgi:hypothetical protein